jgi:hypothetical protein
VRRRNEAEKIAAQFTKFAIANRSHTAYGFLVVAGSTASGVNLYRRIFAESPLSVSQSRSSASYFRGGLGSVDCGSAGFVFVFFVIFTFLLWLFISGRVVSRHTSDAAAEHARLRTPHGRVVTLTHDLPVGSLVFGSDILADHNARWS